jgi:hypothetical protein
LGLQVRADGALGGFRAIFDPGRWTGSNNALPVEKLRGVANRAVRFVVRIAVNHA